MAVDDFPFDGWEDENLEKTASEALGIGSDSDLPDEVRFVAGVAKLIRKRYCLTGDDPTVPSIFLLKPSVVDGVPAKRVPMLDNGATSVAGKLWFVSASVVAGSYTEISTDDDDLMFQFVTDNLKLGDTPAIVFDPRGAELEARYYSEGLQSLETYTPIRLDANNITISEIFDAIDKIHLSCLVTPEAQINANKLWANSEKGWPSSKAEEKIQAYLKAGLTTAFPTCTIRHEQEQIEGRLDLEIEETDPLHRYRFTRHAVLELKVLRSAGEGGSKYSDETTKEWIESGVKQAASYRDGKGYRLGALCCFDMRVADGGNGCFDHVKDLADRLSVSFKRWFLFCTSDKYRDALVNAS